MDWTQIVITIINVILVPIIFIGVKELITYLQSKTKNEKMYGYINLFGEAVTKAVADVSQTFTDELKAKGSLSADSAKEAFDKAYSKAVSIIGVNAYQGYELLLGDADAYITSLIEAKVKETKKVI